MSPRLFLGQWPENDAPLEFTNEHFSGHQGPNWGWFKAKNQVALTKKCWKRN